MLANIPLPPHAKAVYCVFFLSVCVAALGTDFLLRRRSIFAAVACAFTLVVACFWYVQSLGVSWSLFADRFWAKEHGLLKEDYFPGGEWFDWVLASPYLLKWYLLPPYAASLAIRLLRKSHGRPGPNSAASGNGATTLQFDAAHPRGAMPERGR
jgi:hypothetical protein